MKRAIKEFNIRFTNHASIRSRERAISPEEIEEVILGWEVIERYSKEEVLLWGGSQGRIIHVVCRIDEANKIILVLTVYCPKDNYFTPESNYRKRRKR